VKISEPLEASAVDGDTYGGVWGGYWIEHIEISRYRHIS